MDSRWHEPHFLVYWILNGNEYLSLPMGHAAELAIECKVWTSVLMYCEIINKQIVLIPERNYFAVYCS